MENKVQFEQNLVTGKRLECSVREQLSRLLPNYTIRITDQDKDSLEREEFSLVDVIVLKGDHPVLGIECKWGDVKLNNCLTVNGWDGDYNTPLNNTSLRKYKEAQFPVYLINVNHWCHKAFAADLPTILKSPNDAGKYVKKSGVIRYNVCSKSWMVYEDKWSVKTILTDILRKEKLC